MTQEQQRIKIAEACGFTIGTKETSTWSILKNGRFHSCFSGKRLETATLADGLKYLPDYLNDLNAMHKAEKQLEAEDNHAYGCYCFELYEKYGNTVSLTAAQRAEAFLKTLNLWKP